MRFAPTLAVLATVFFVACPTGCNRQEAITKYSIPAPSRPSEEQMTAGGSGHKSSPAGAATRMLAAIVPKGSQTWFFKLVGPEEAVGNQQDRFNSFVESLQFDNDTSPPRWELPPGWQQRGASGMRMATLEIEQDGQILELTVIPLQTRGDVDPYVLANINRWRGELGLAPLDELESDGKNDPTAGVRQFDLDDSTPVTLVDIRGSSGAAHTSAGGFDMANHPPLGAETFDTGAKTSDAATITYSTPEGWTSLPASGMRQAAFQVVDGEQKVEITVISLPQFGGERLANINRWREQISLEPITADQLAGELSQIELAEAKGDYIELHGPTDSDPQQSIIAVLADVQGSTWFIKLMGNADLAARERDRFRGLVQSVKFSGAKDGASNE